MRIGELQFRILVSDPLYTPTTLFSNLPHNHSRYEVQLVTEGQVYVHTAATDYTAKKGDLCIVHPYEYHTYLRPVDNEPAMLTCLSFYIDDTVYPDTNKDIDVRLIKDILDRTYTLHDDTGNMETLFALIQNEMDGRRPGYLISIQALLTSLIVCLLQRLCTKHPMGKPDQTCFYNPGREDIIENFFLYEYPNSPTIGELADRLHLCTRRVSELITQLYGCSFSQKLINTRIEIAKLYLLYSEYSVGEISQICGFNSPNYFFTTFRKMTGRSPQQYRTTTFIPFADHIKYR